MLSIRNATVADIPLIKELAIAVWPQTYTPIVGADQVAYMLDLFYSPAALQKQMETQHQHFLICYDEATPVAFASYSEMEPHVFQLHKLYIIPQQQGKGVGRFIINHIVQQLKIIGAHSLHLNVNRYNIAAKTFYEKTGFTHLKDEDIDIGNGYFMNDYVLSIAL